MAPPSILQAPIVRHDVLGSTNDECLRLAASGAVEGTLVVADRQTAGRGRNGRTWVSPPGVGLYASLLLRPPGTDGLTLLPLLAGVAAAEAIRAAAACEAFLKWPNDVLVADRKVAGLLVEADLAPHGSIVVLGLGVNVNTPAEALPARALYPASSLRLETGRLVDRDALLLAWRERVARWLAPWRGGDSATLLARWSELDALRGRDVCVAGADGGDVRGRDEGVDADGALRVRTADGHVIPVVAGDVLRAKRRSSGGRC